MEAILFENDIMVLYVQATSFPEGVQDAYHRLNDMVPDMSDRKIFGLSRPENNCGIVYLAAVDGKESNESEKLRLPTLTIKKGRYRCITIPDFMNHIPDIQKAFQVLLAHHDHDSDGYCVEWYINEKDVRCMVRINE